MKIWMISIEYNSETVCAFFRAFPTVSAIKKAQGNKTRIFDAVVGFDSNDAAIASKTVALFAENNFTGKPGSANIKVSRNDTVRCSISYIPVHM